VFTNRKPGLLEGANAYLQNKRRQQLIDPDQEVTVEMQTSWPCGAHVVICDFFLSG